MVDTAKCRRYFEVQAHEQNQQVVMESSNCVSCLLAAFESLH